MPDWMYREPEWIFPGLIPPGDITMMAAEMRPRHEGKSTFSQGMIVGHEDIWTCDGGDFTGTHDEVERHVMDQFDPDEPLADAKCWGGILVGSDVYYAWLAGVHPMSTLMGEVLEAYTQYQQAISDLQ